MIEYLLKRMPMYYKMLLVVLIVITVFFTPAFHHNYDGQVVYYTLADSLSMDVAEGVFMTPTNIKEDLLGMR